MDHSFSLDIIIFAVIAAVLLFRLRKVLGERGDNDPPAIDAAALLRARQSLEKAAEKTGPVPAGLNERGAAPPAANWAQSLPDYQTVLNATAHHRLLPLAAIDPDFQPQTFLNGAKRAYEIIVVAFAKGDLARLEPLLTPELFATFKDEVTERQERGEQLQLMLHAVKQALISDAELDGTRAFVTVDFTTEQTITLRDAQGQIPQNGAPGNNQDGTLQTLHERWVFTNDLQDDETLWRLSDTDALDD